MPQSLVVIFTEASPALVQPLSQVDLRSHLVLRTHRRRRHPGRREGAHLRVDLRLAPEARHDLLRTPRHQCYGSWA